MRTSIQVVVIVVVVVVTAAGAEVAGWPIANYKVTHPPFYKVTNPLFSVYPGTGNKELSLEGHNQIRFFDATS